MPHFGDAPVAGSLFGCGVPQSWTLTLETLTLTDALEKARAKILSETIALTDSLARQTSKAFAEVLALTDSLARQTSKAFAEVLALVDWTHAGRLVLVALTEAFALTDVMARARRRLLTYLITRRPGLR